MLAGQLGVAWRVCPCCLPAVLVLHQRRSYAVVVDDFAFIAVCHQNVTCKQYVSNVTVVTLGLCLRIHPRVFSSRICSPCCKEIERCVFGGVRLPVTTAAAERVNRSAFLLTLSLARCNDDRLADDDADDDREGNVMIG